MSGQTVVDLYGQYGRLSAIIHFTHIESCWLCFALLQQLKFSDDMFSFCIAQQKATAFGHTRPVQPAFGPTPSMLSEYGLRQWNWRECVQPGDKRAV